MINNESYGLVDAGDDDYYDDSDTDELTEESGGGGDEVLIQLDTKSQWLSTLFNPSREIRKVAAEWNIRLFIWQRFWDRLFESEEYSSKKGHPAVPLGPDDELQPDLLPWEPRKQDTAIGNAPPFLQHFKGTMWERHQENIRIAAAVGVETYQQAIDQLSEQHHNFELFMKLRTICMKDLTGVDLYWNGLVEARPTRKDASGSWYRKQAQNTSKSKFGSLRIWPFPFTAIFRFDDVPEFAIFSMSPLVNGIRRLPSEGLAQLEAFVKLNISEPVMKAKELRLQLRSMDGSNIQVKVGEKRREVTCQFFILHREAEDLGDLWKNNTTNEIVSIVPGFDYEVRTTAQQKTEAKCTAFLCGEKEAAVHPDHFLRHVNDDDPEVEKDDFTEGARALDPQAYHIEYPQYFHPDDEGLRAIILNPQNIQDKFLEYVKKLYQSYRDRMQEMYTWKANTLSYEFWLKIYHDDHISKDELKALLQKYETDSCPLLKDLLNEGPHADRLDELYQRLDTFDKSNVIACWYMFWHAIELHNRARKGALFTESIQRILDPTEPGSIMAVKHTRADLERYLMANEVWKPDGSGVITDELIDALYTKLDELQTMAVLKMTQQWKANVTPRAQESSRNFAGALQRLTDARQSNQKEAEEDFFLKEVNESTPLVISRPERFNNNRGACARICGNEGCIVM